ncbi:MAG TPA: ATP-binding protein, partial [Gemmatimonadaceae bacterium]|nr:ATP-binding protein [Gemmatimonadaceae bacterium]
VYRVLADALEKNDVVIVDDFQLIAIVSCCSHAYPRLNLMAAALVPLAAMAEDVGKTLVFATEHVPIAGLYQRFPTAHIAEFTVDDFNALCAHYLGAARAHTLDMRRIHRFAPKLNARQLRKSCEALREDAKLDTERFVDYLREHHMASNVDLGEVQAVNLQDLKGLDDVLDALEANVILPLENSQVADELQLKPKRGVLLAGPPGTGKTTIGRALAHRLKSKFFLIDGTVISGTPEFYPRIHRIFEAAKQNAPGIIFIDDSDVIFESGHDTGLYRFLLTMLDGLESASAGRICLMMTAMDVANLPPALVRSGRIELWLETRLPDPTARAAILVDLCAGLPKAIGQVDIDALATASEGLSGADLKRVVEDGKLLFAYERVKKSGTRPPTEFFVRAVETVRRNKEHYAAAEARARMRHPVRPPYFDAFGASYDVAMGAMTAAMSEGEGGVSPSAFMQIMPTAMMRVTEDDQGD